MRSSFERVLIVFCVVVLFGLSILGFLTSRVNRMVDDTNNWMLHTREVLFKAEQVSHSIIEYQYATGGKPERAYKKTADSIHSSLKNKISSLQYLTRDNQAQQQRIKKLKDIFAYRYSFADEKYQNITAGQKLLAEIQKVENELLKSRTSANNSSRRSFNTLFYIILMAGFLLLISTFFALRKYLNLQKKSENTILQMNQNLEKLVEEKASQLIEKEKQYQLVLDNLLEGAQIIDYDWRYTYVNRALLKQARLSEDEMLGSKMSDLFPGITETSLFKELTTAMKTRTPRKIENTFQYPNGDAAHYELSIEPVKEGLFVLSMDITDRKIKELYKEQYIAELEKVLFKISHEVRSPVVKILGVANLMELSLIKEEELPMIIGSMKSCALLLDTYTRELSDFVTEMKENSAGA